MAACPICGKKLKSQRGVQDHIEAVHTTPADRRPEVDVFECIADDLPDGAYFAMMDEMGVDPLELIDE